MYLEIILIVLWVIIPILFKYYFDKDGSKLLDGPVYLNKKHDIGNFENLHQKNYNELKYLNSRTVPTKSYAVTITGED